MPPVRLLGLTLALAACHGAPRTPRVEPRPGLEVAIYEPRRDASSGPVRFVRGFVDDRRWLEVPADGWLDLDDVAGDLELDSVVVTSATDPGGFAVSGCRRLGVDRGVGTGAWLVGHTVTMTTAAGAEVRGVVRDVGGLLGVIRDDERGEVEVDEITELPGGEGQVGAPSPSMLGQLAYGRTRGGDHVYGVIVALRAATATVETGATVTRVELGALAQLEVEGVRGAPTLRCHVRARRPGRHLVRTAYASGSFRWSASYRAILPSGGGEVASVPVSTRFRIDASGFATARPATVALHAGMPDGDDPPAAVWRGTASIGGGPVVVVGEPVEREARFGWVYRGALTLPDEEATNDYWHAASHGLVWQELALAPRPTDVPGPIEVVIDAAAARVVTDQLPPADLDRPTAIRIPITASSTLIGFRRKRLLVHDNRALADEILYSVVNRGDRPERVTIEEELRGLRGAVLRHQRPEGAGELRPDRYRRVVELAPGETALGAIVVQYANEPIERRGR